ncbi:MAG TPA: SAM-dependent methyltransferase [Cyclobacteriaceae bacterium]|nr:SAM-dependent methyltransferase [Cyclobacteriaceae bacterium]
MISSLLQPEVQQFILEHENDDEKNLILKHRTIHGVPSSAIAEQIIGRRKAKAKLPLYYVTPGIIYPPGLNLEQSSSQETAVFKANTLHSIVGPDKTLADLTGGLGIDSLFFSRTFNKVCYIEPNSRLLSVAQHNHEILQAKNIDYYNSTATDFLKSLREKVGCVFIDPSRRSNSNQKVFRLSDCEPNVLELVEEVFQKTDFLLIKTAPLLDILQGAKELKNVEKVWVVSVNNECKELLFLCRKDFEGEPVIVAINLQTDQPELEFKLSEEKETTATFSEPLTYLYEPNASVLKAGAFKLVSEKFLVLKLHPSTHLYTSDNLIKNFPGRIFKIIKPVKADPKSLKEFFTEGNANVITRNYSLTPEELKKKTKLKDGGEHYLVGFSGQKEKYLVAAKRLK